MGGGRESKLAVIAIIWPQGDFSGVTQSRGESWTLESDSTGESGKWLVQVQYLLVV